MCRPVMAPLKAGPCNKETGFQTTELTIGRVVLLPPPQNRYACLVKKVKMKRRCACPKPARTVKCRRNVLITVTVTQKLKGQKCIKAKKVDKKATKCPKNSISETKCRSDNTKVVTKVTYRKRNCKCERKVKHRRVLCRCPDPIISTRCVRHTIKERSTVSYQLKSERCRRKKQVSKKKIKCKGGTKVTRTKCDKRCNQKVTKVTRYIRNCECRKKTDISSVKCCCPKSVTRVACIDDSRRVVTTTSWRLVRGACQRKARKREKKIVCLSNLKPIRGPCKRNGYRQVTFASYRLRKCKCVRVQRKSNELCRCPRSHSESSCRSERLVTRRTRYRLQSTGRGKKVCTRHVRNLVRSPGCPVDKRVKTTKCREDDFKRITTVRRYQKNCKCRKSVKTEKQRCRCPKSSKKVSCHSDNVIKVLRTTYTLRGNSCLKDEQTKATKVVCYEKEKPDRSPCGDDGYRQVKLISYQARDCKCTRRVRVLRERCSCPKDYRARECINNNVVSTFVTYTLTSKECIRRSKITKEKPKCKSISKKSKGACRSDGFQSVFYEHEKLVNCECQKQVQTRKIRCACPKTRVKRRCVDNKIVTTKTSFKLGGNRCHRSRSHHRSRVSCPAKKRVVKHKCVGNKRIYEYLEHRLRNCACKLVRQRVVKPCRCPKPKTIEKPCVAGKQKVVTIYYVKDRMGNCKKMTDVDTEVCARRKTCRCDALGDPHFLMYDGVPLHFQGECKYTLTKLRNPADPCAFDVQVKNEHRGDNKNYTYVRLLDVKIFGRVFRLHQHKRLLVDGKIVSLPYTGPGFRVFYSGPYVQFVATKCRFSAAFDGRYTGYVEVGKQYAGRMVGLCGNCNGKQKDDYVTREGVNVIAKKDNFERDNLVGNSFRVPDDSDKPGKRCKNTPALSASSACSNAWIPRARALCRRLSDRRGPFGKCIASGRVPSLALANDCRNDACVNRLKPAALRRAVCEAHKDLAEQCAEAGFSGLRWRTKTFCPMKCDKDKVYTTKMQPCPKSCENLFFGTKANCYNLPKREGCACKKGLVLDGRKCVRPEMCQCVKKFPELMCKDDASAKKCRRWRAAGHCASNPYTMLKMCRRTCGLCHTKKAKASCRNIMSVRRCKILKRKGQCGTSFVSTACRRTCGLCKAGDKIVEEKSTNKTAKSSRRGHTVVLRSTEDKD